MIARFISGIASGTGTSITPVYINEISPEAITGILGSFVQLQICLGIAFAYIIGIPLDLISYW